MFLIIKKLKYFSAAHRLIGSYTGPCQHLHGHNYGVTVKLGATHLTSVGFVIDFDEVKKYLDNWVQKHWDHATLVSEEDMALLEFLKKEKQKHYIIPAKNTSSEILAHYLFTTFHTITEEIGAENNLKLLEVRVQESQTSTGAYQAPCSH